MGGPTAIVEVNKVRTSSRQNVAHMAVAGMRIFGASRIRVLCVAVGAHSQTRKRIPLAVKNCFQQKVAAVMAKALDADSGDG